VFLIAGALIAFGKRPAGLQLESEFGTYPDFCCVEIRVYF